MNDFFRTFSISFRLRNTYKANGFIHSLKSIPLIRKLLPASLYASNELKIVANVFSGIAEFFSVFFFKAVYLLLLFLAASEMKVESADAYAHILLFLTIIGGKLNTSVFDPSKDKYYAIVLMRMSAKKYAVTSFLYFLSKTAVGMLLFSLVFGGLCKADLLTCICVPVYIIAVKMISAGLVLYGYRKKGVIKKELKDALIGLIEIGFLLALAFVPPALGYSLAEFVLPVVTLFSLIPAVFAGKYFFTYRFYQPVYKGLLKPERIFLSPAGTGKIQQEMVQKTIAADTTIKSSKNGYDYFNDLFMKRHAKILTKSAKKITLALIACLALVVLLNFIFPKDSMELNKMLLTYLPYFLFIMYCINRGPSITQAMFMNCDHSMLTYRFYRQPKALLSLFKVRLWYIIKVNLVPALVIAIGLPLLLFLSGGTENILNYPVMFFSILSMSIFFSVHSMVLYYLLQPYNVELEKKSAIYGLLNVVTYIVCYIGINVKLPTLLFGSVMIVFCVTYILVALLLAYKLAPKTFRLRN